MAQFIKRGKNKWLVRIPLGRDANGKRLYHNKTINGTKRDAEKYATAKKREMDLGIFVEPTSQTLEEYLERWLNDIARPRVRENSFYNYKCSIRKHIIPKLGSIRLCSLQAVHIQNLYNEMLKQGISAKTVRYAHTVLSSALEQAVKWGFIAINPCERCELPRVKKKEMRFLKQEEVVKFLEAARNTCFYCLFLIAIETGMRPEEYLALQWKDIDFEHKRLTVQRVLLERKGLGGGFSFQEPKTKHSKRLIPLSNSAINALREHRKNQLERRMKLGASYKDTDLVFTSRAGTPLCRDVVTKVFKRILQRAGITTGIRLYDLRHTTATLLLLSGENPKVVSERLGHSTVVITLDVYSHVLPTMQESATKKLEELMFGVGS